MALRTDRDEGRTRDGAAARSARARLLAGAALLACIGCQTAASTTMVKKKDGTLYFLVSHDERATTPKPKDSPALREASRRLKAKLKKDPTDVDSQTSMAQLALANGDLKGAATMARRAMNIDFRDREAKVILAHVAFLEQRPDEARTLIRQLGGEAAPESEVLNLLAGLAWADGDVPTAEKLFIRAIAKNGDDVAARMNLGIVQLRRDNVAAAQLQFKEVLKRVPDNADAMIHIGVTYAMQGKIEKALSFYRIAGDASKNSPLLIYNIAVAQKRGGKYDDAVESMDQFLRFKQLKDREREAALALLEDIKVEQVAKDSDGSEKLDSLIADARERRKEAGSADGDSGTSSVGSFYAH